MKIVFAKHPDDPKKKDYIFSVPTESTVSEGDILLVETSKGPQIAIATSGTIEADDVRVFYRKFGAVYPIKHVLQICGAEIRRYIQRHMAEEISATLRELC